MSRDTWAADELLSSRHTVRGSVVLHLSQVLSFRVWSWKREIMPNLHRRGRARGSLAVIGTSVGLVVASLAFGAVGLQSLPAAADPLSSCTATAGVIVAVDFAKFPTAPEAGNAYIGCAPTPTTGTLTTGYTAFALAGFTTAGDQHDGTAFICRIGVSEIPNSQEPTSAQDACINTPPTTALWNYWHANAGATTWTFSATGAMGYQPQPGSIDAWSYGPEDTQPTLTPQQVRAESVTVPTTLTVKTSTLPGAAVGVKYTQAIAAAGGVAPYTFTKDAGSSLPPGLALSSSGTLSGTPTAAGTTIFTVDVSDSAGNTTTGNLSLTVGGTAPSITSGTSATFTAGSAGSFTVTTQGHPTAALSHTGTLPAGVTFVDNHDGTATLAGTPGAGTAGSYSITIDATNGVSPNASQPFTLTVNATGFRVTTTSLPDALVGTPYGQQLTTAGGTGPFKWAKKAKLPTGLTLSASGELSGTPSAKAIGPFTVEVTVTSATKATASASIPLKVDEVSAITSASTASFHENVANTFAVVATGYPTPTITEAGSLPHGVTLGSTGVLSGTATQSGSFPVTITAHNGVGSDATQRFTLTVIASLTITTTTLPKGSPGTAYPSTQFQATGGTAPYVWKKTATLPQGLKLSAGGVLSGTLSAKVVAGTYPIGLLVTDSGGKAKQTADASLNLAVS
jgi:hypothetical protein